MYDHHTGLLMIGICGREDTYCLVEKKSRTKYKGVTFHYDEVLPSMVFKEKERDKQIYSGYIYQVKMPIGVKIDGKVDSN